MEGGGRETKEGWGYCEWKAKCFSDTGADMLWWAQRGAPVLLSAGQGSFNGSITSWFFLLFYFYAQIYLSECTCISEKHCLCADISNLFKCLTNDLYTEVIKKKTCIINFILYVMLNTRVTAFKHKNSWQNWGILNRLQKQKPSLLMLDLNTFEFSANEVFLFPWNPDDAPPFLVAVFGDAFGNADRCHLWAWPLLSVWLLSKGKVFGSKWRPKLCATINRLLSV